MRRKSMALLSSSYPAAFQSGLPCSGLLPLGAPSSGQLPYPNISMMRVPPHIAVGFSVANFSAAYFQSSQRSDTDYSSDSPLMKHHHPSPFYHEQRSILKRSSNTPIKRKGVTNFSIAGILGTEDEDSCIEKLSDGKQDKTAALSTAPTPTVTTNSREDSCTDEHDPKVHVKMECLTSPTVCDNERANPLARFSWLQCTRYKPPRLPRAKRKDGAKKRKLGRNPRVPFSPSQVATLEQKFRCTHYLSSIDVAELSASLNLSENRVKIWFQNRRARERRDKEAASKDSSSSPPSSALMKPCGSPAPTSGPSPLLAVGRHRLSPSPVDSCVSAFTPLTYAFNRSSYD